MFIITGFFFPSGLPTSKTTDRLSVDIVRDTYGGIVSPRTNFFKERVHGAVQCSYGFARVLNWRSTPESVYFNLSFQDQDTLVACRFRQRDDNVWLGTYTGFFGKGYATCLIAEVGDHAIHSEYVARKLLRL